MARATLQSAARMTLNAAVIGVLTGAALGQTRSQQPGPMSGLGGVRSAAPAPMSGLGGVRSGVPSVRPLGPSPTNPGTVTPAFVQVVRPAGSGSSFSGSRFVGGSGTPFTEGSGFRADGSFNGSNFRLRAHLGSGFTGVGEFRGFDRDHHHHNHGGGFVGYPFFASYPWWYNTGWYDTGNHYTTIYGDYSPLDPNMAGTPAPATMPAPVTEQVEPSSARDLGATYLAAGDAKVATTTLRAWLRDNPGDAEAMRLLAVALLETGQLSDASATMALAYHTDPSLASKPIPAGIFQTEQRARDDVRRGSVYANRVKSGSAWLTVAVLMQAEGRESVARPVVEKAKAAGLESAVADRLLASLR